jgi:hypothetical protein
MVSAEGGSNIEDPATFFANVFGGERFMDYVRGVASVCLPSRVPPSSFQNEDTDFFFLHVQTIRSEKSR